MKRVEKENLISERFDSLQEFVGVVEHRPVLFGDSRDKKNDSWRGEKKIEDAWEYLQFGNKKLLKDIKLELDNPKTKVVMKRKTFNDVVGFMPNVPNMLMGVPKSMINQKRIQVKSKIITLLVDVDVSCNVSKHEVIQHGSQVVKAIQALESNGYRVELTVMASFARQYSGKGHIVSLPIKAASQPLDLLKVAYPLTSVAMLRYIFFDWYESCPNAVHISGYGSPLYHWRKEKREAFLKEAFPDRNNVVYVKFGDNVLDVVQEGAKK